MLVYAEAATLESFTSLTGEQCIHEYPATKHDRREIGLPADLLAYGSNHRRESVMKSAGNRRGLDALLSIAADVANERSGVDGVGQLERIRTFIAARFGKPLQLHRGLAFVTCAMRQAENCGHGIEKPAGA